MHTGENHAQGMHYNNQRRPSADQHNAREEEVRLLLWKEEKTSTG